MKLSFRMPGPPIRFLYLVLGLWVGGRIIVTAAFGPAEETGVQGSETSSVQTATIIASPVEGFIPRRPGQRVMAGKLAPMQSPVFLIMPRTTASEFEADHSGDVGAAHGESGSATGIVNRTVGFPAMVPSAPSGSKDRWSLSAWMLYRPNGRESGLASGGQLGASQIGARLDYDLSPEASHRLAVHGRLTSAVQSPAAAEAAVGLTFQPSRNLPLALSVERRIAISYGGRDAFAVYAAGGIGPTQLGTGVELEGYAQAGLVGANRADAFADGRMAIGGRLTEHDSDNALSAGLAVSGGTQPGLSRLDTGPHVTARFRLGGGYARAILEWRERVLGDARPDSGLAFVLAADF